MKHLITAKTIEGATSQYTRTLLAVEGGSLKKEYLVTVLKKVASASLEDAPKLFDELDVAVEALKKADEELGKRVNRNITALFNRVKKFGLKNAQNQLAECGDLTALKYDELVNLFKVDKKETKATKDTKDTKDTKVATPTETVITVDTNAAIESGLKEERAAVIDSAALLAKMPLNELTEEFEALIGALDKMLLNPAKNREKMAVIVAHLNPLI